jgi:hypothetical protein
MLIVQLVLYAVDECAASNVEDPEVRLALSAHDGSCSLEFETSGAGPRSGTRIFEGMLRGKSSQASAGLALARQTVAAHFGTVDVTSSELGGALIRVTLPETLAVEPLAAPELAPPPRHAPPVPSFASRSGRETEPCRASSPPRPITRAPESRRTPLKLDLDFEGDSPELSEAPGLELETSTLAPPSDGNPGLGSKGLIVWIDEDEACLRGMARAITTHETLLLGSIAEASELFEDLDVLPALILCDVTLADGLGTDLHRSVDPQLAERFVFVTGGVIGQEAAEYLQTSGRPTLIKPITIGEVHRLLSAALDPEPPFARHDTQPDTPPEGLSLELGNGDELDW